MKLMNFIFIFAFWSVLFSQIKAHKECKCTPQSECWPSRGEWEELNYSLGGVLLQTRPPGFLCHTPYYEKEGCNLTSQVYYSSSWRYNHPVAMQISNFELDEEGEGCLGVATAYRYKYCFQGAIPYYTVNATTYKHVSLAVDFARENNLRLVIKNTGHDFLGRSSGKGSLSIWTHNMKNISFNDNYNSGCSSTSYRSVSIGAGVQLFELYAAVAERGLDVVAGSSYSVGAAGGYVQGGGHSPLSPAFGLSAETILEFKVITADGKLRIANECRNKDLFWALRGGGGGTYGVVVEATFRAFLIGNITLSTKIFQATDPESYREMLVQFLLFSKTWADMGWGTYMTTDIDTFSFSMFSILAEANLTLATETFSPILNYVSSNPKLNVSGSLLVLPFYGFYSRLFGSLANETAGAEEFLVSRLVPRYIFENTTTVENMVDLSIAAGVTEFYQVAGGAVAKRPEWESGLNPAWRNALWHIIAGSGVPENASWAETKQIEQSLSDAFQPLRDLTPGSGCYANEASRVEPNWQQAFFGSHYDQLLEIKQLYDPTSLFLCRNCVGSEGWDVDYICREK